MTTIYQLEKQTSIDELPFLDVEGSSYSADPYLVLRDAQRDSWIYRSQRGVEILRYEAQRSLLRDRRFGQDHALLAEAAGITDPEVIRFRNEVLVNTKGAAHAALRATVAQFFGKDQVGKLRSAVRSLIHELVDEAMVDGGNTVELFASLCRPAPAVTYTKLAHAPVADADFVARVSDDILKMFLRDPSLSPVIESAYHELSEYIDRRFEEVRGEGGDDLISHLVSLIETGRLTWQQAKDLAILTLEASTDNTSHQMAMVISVLLEEPGVWAALVANPSSISAAVEEAVRLRPRTLNIDRIAQEDLVWRNLEVPAGTAFVASTMITSRDPDIYPHADTYDLARIDAAPQQMWGGGMTACLGSNLARMEIEETVAVLTSRFPDMELRPSAPMKLARHNAEVGSLVVSLG